MLCAENLVLAGSSLGKLFLHHARAKRFFAPADCDATLLGATNLTAFCSYRPDVEVRRFAAPVDRAVVVGHAYLSVVRLCSRGRVRDHSLCWWCRSSLGFGSAMLMYFRYYCSRHPESRCFRPLAYSDLSSSRIRLRSKQQPSFSAACSAPHLAYSWKAGAKISLPPRSRLHAERHETKHAERYETAGLGPHAHTLLATKLMKNLNPALPRAAISPPPLLVTRGSIFRLGAGRTKKQSCTGWSGKPAPRRTRCTTPTGRGATLRCWKWFDPRRSRASAGAARPVDDRAVLSGV